MKKIALCQIPGMDVRAPSQGIAVLKAIALSKSFDAKCFDLNISVWNDLVDEGLGYLWADWSIEFAYALMNDKEFHELQSTSYDEETANRVLSCMHFHIDSMIYEYDPDVIGFSLFSIVQENTARIVIDYIKENYKDIEIIIGGPALRHYHEESLPKDILDKVDDYFIGDAEESFVNYLDGKKDFGGLNNINVNMHFDRDIWPSPDYRDFDFSLYPSKWREPHVRSSDEGTVYVTGSKGCVRACEFCDVHKIWPKFYQKQVNTVLRDIKSIREYFKFRNVFFTDSLINGSNKFIKDLSQGIIDEFGEKPFSWSGQWICKSKKSFTEEYFEIASRAGLNQIIVGIESGSEKVRWEMNKKFYNEDIYFTLEMCRKYNILFIPLMIAGYPTETDDDFKQTLDLAKKWIEYRDVVRPTCINMMMLLPGTDVTIDHDKYQLANITYAEVEAGYTPLDQNWSCGDNDYEKRIERFYEYQYQIKKAEMGLGHVKRKTLKRDYLNIAKIPNPELIHKIDYVNGIY
mgnify:FL=1|tara:strand:- start:4191 stop:5741 length:1551 start_codon:yes stop_codon:yes gene_type:complete